MCGIIVTNNIIDNLEIVNKFCKNRGPDKTTNIFTNGYNFIHNLLHITGKITEQPIINNNCIAIFNGEIYNYKNLYENAESDSECIIPTYLKYGDKFISELDGDFCLILFDFNNNKIFISSDTFKTKPLFYYVNNDKLIISSYLSCCKELDSTLNYNEIKPNECLIYSLNDFKLIKKLSITNFDLTQYKNSYDDWNKSFEQSVLKRLPENSIPLVCLSSGMDSGSISCCIEKNKKNFYPISISKNENIYILNERKKQHKYFEYLNLSNNDKLYYKNYLDENCEPCFWDWTYHKKLNKIDNAFIKSSMLGTSAILNYIKKKDNTCRVMLSGIGGDEIMARNFFYSCGYGQVDEFPIDLKEVFPWPNFFYGSQYNYIKGQEYIGGCFNFETRYPFLDKNVVQEFLWLSPELKNGNKNKIKPVLENYLKKNNYPYHIKKLGFSV